MPLPKVLVVDDAALSRRLFRRILSEHGYSVVEAASAEEAVPLLQSSPPRVMLLDVELPGMSGIRLLEFLRSKKFAVPPTILTTGLKMPREMAEAAARWVGINNVYVKGDDTAVLVNAVNRLSRTSLEVPVARVLQRGRLTADLDSTKVRFGEAPIRLHGRRSFDLLCALLADSEPQSRETLHRRIWDDSENSIVVNVNVMRLRRDLAAFPAVRILAESSGYRLVVD